MDEIPDELRETCFPFSFDDELVVNTLGLLWLPDDSNFCIRVQIGNNSLIYTKRRILSVISSIFDLFGLISPVTVTAKLLMQSLWTLKDFSLSQASLYRDEEIPIERKAKWIEFLSNLLELHGHSIQRHLFGDFVPTRTELHSFSDASEKAYGTVVCFRSLNGDQVCNSVLFSKSRVAPLKKPSLPKLELCAMSYWLRFLRK